MTDKIFAESEGDTMTNNESTTSNVFFSNRGFAQTEAVMDKHGGTIRTYASSAADGPHVWVSTNSASVYSESGEGIVHLSLQQARQLAANLGAIIAQTERDWGLEPNEEYTYDEEDYDE